MKTEHGEQMFLSGQEIHFQVFPHHTHFLKGSSYFKFFFLHLNADTVVVKDAINTEYSVENASEEWPADREALSIGNQLFGAAFY